MVLLPRAAAEGKGGNENKLWKTDPPASCIHVKTVPQKRGGGKRKEIIWAGEPNYKALAQTPGKLIS